MRIRPHLYDPPIQALLATTDAPVYFEGPTQINDAFYVDGGVGGNCPLKQAIPTALELFGEDADLLVVSMAPPTPVPQRIPKGVLNQIVYWFQYFPRRVVNRVCGKKIGKSYIWI